MLLFSITTNLVAREVDIDGMLEVVLGRVVELRLVVVPVIHHEQPVQLSKLAACKTSGI